MVAGMAGDEGGETGEWNADRRAELVLELLEGELTVEQAAEKHGLDVATIESWKRDFVAGGRVAVGARTAKRTAPSPPVRWGKLLAIAGGALAAIAVLGLGLWLVLRPKPSEQELECNRATVELIRALREPMTITAYTTQGMPELDRAGEQLDRILEGWAKEAGGKLTYRRVIVDTDDKRREAKEHGLQESAFAEGDGGTAAIVTGYFGLVVAYGAEKEVIPMLTPNTLDGVEFWIANKIRSVRAKAENQKIGVAVLDGAGQIGLDDQNLVPRQTAGSPSIESILHQSFPFYSIRRTPAAAGVEPLKEQAVLVVTQPSRDLTDQELALIDEFLMLGDKTVVFVTGAVNLDVADTRMKVKLSRRRVDTLLGHYGIELRQDLVVDPAGSLKLSIVGVDGTRALTSQVALIATHDPAAAEGEQALDNRFPGFFRLDTVALPIPSSLILHPDKQPEATLAAVARSSAEATVRHDDGLAIAPGETLEGKGAAERRVLAAVLSGTIKSAYGDKKAAGRVLVIASPLFVTNPFARAGNPPPSDAPAMFGAVGGDPALLALAQSYAQQHLTATILSLKNVLDWATVDEGIIACSALLITKR